MLRFFAKMIRQRQNTSKTNPNTPKNNKTGNQKNPKHNRLPKIRPKPAISAAYKHHFKFNYPCKSEQYAKFHQTNTSRTMLNLKQKTTFCRNKKSAFPIPT
jgi:hypothetical protein